MFNFDIESLLLGLFALVIALTIHEAAHAFVAFSLGDMTAKNLGRLTLNPLAHLDPLGTIMIILTLLSGFGIGWGKPVPVNIARLRPSPTVGMALVAAGGPASNLLLAALCALFIRAELGQAVAEFLFISMSINVFLAVFNLIPIPPLDGFRVLMGFLPPQAAYRIAPLEQYGPVILLLIVFSGTGIIGSIMNAVGRPILRAMLAA